MKANEIFKKLLAVDNTAPRVLHAIFGLDLKKDFHIFAIPSRFTAKQILKEATAAGYDPQSSIIAVLTQPNADYIFADRLYLATLNESEKFDIDYRRAIPYEVNGKRTKLDDYFTRGDFENIRKDNEQSFIICQKRADLAPKNEHPADLSARFRVESFRRWHYQNSTVSYIGEIETRRTDDNGRKYIYNRRGNVIFRGRNEYRDISELIDKSGYIVDKKREELKERAEALRAERAKAAYTETNNAAEVAELRARFEAKKAELISKLAAAETAPEFKAIIDKLWKYDGIAGIFGDLERLEARESAKEFSSLEAFNRASEKIAAALAAI